jgi:hypothetical protein
MGLLDGLLTFFVALSVLLTWQALETASWAALLGASAAGSAAVLAKTPGVLVAIAPPLVALAVGSGRRLAGRVAVATAAPLVAFLALQVGRTGSGVRQQFLDRWAPYRYSGGNLEDLTDALVAYALPGVMALALVGLWVVGRRRRRWAVALAVLILAWTVPWVVLSNFAPSRYYLPALPWVCLLAAIGALELVRLGRRRGRWIAAASMALVAAVAASLAWSSARLVLDHPHARLSRLDDWQYRSGPPSGYGYRAAWRFAVARARPGSRLACLISGNHANASECGHDVPAGVVHLGRFVADAETVPALPPRGLLAVADDDPALLARWREVEAPASLETLARFTRPGGTPGAVVVRVRAID